PVADIGVVHAKLVAVIAQRQRHGEVVRQRREAAEVPKPGIVVDSREADRGGGAVVTEAQDRLRKIGRRDRIVEIRPQRKDRGFAAIGRTGLRPRDHRGIGSGQLRGRGMADWSDGYWESSDGLRLHYRDYAGDASRPPVICIPGLTRNARDFEGVASRLAGAWRVICVDLRGRGESGYARDPMSYVPPTYLQDTETLVRALALRRFVLIGTSLGGLITMLMAAADATRIAGALINDIGPDIERRGLDHIRSYVGKPQNWPIWLHAARGLAEHQGDRYPD